MKKVLIGLIALIIIAVIVINGSDDQQSLSGKTASDSIADDKNSQDTLKPTEKDYGPLYVEQQKTLDKAKELEAQLKEKQEALEKQMNGN